MKQRCAERPPECVKQVVTNTFYLVLAVDARIHRCAFVAGSIPVGIESDQGLCLLVIDLEPLSNSGFAIIGSLHQRFSRNIIFSRFFGKVELNVVSTARSGMDASPAHPSYDFCIIDVELHYCVDDDCPVAQGLRLPYGARESVKEIPSPAIGLSQPLFHQADDETIGHQCTRIHHLFDSSADIRSGLDRRSKHVPGRDLRDAMVHAHETRLSALAGPGSSQKNDSQHSLLPSSRYRAYHSELHPETVAVH